MHTPRIAAKGEILVVSHRLFLSLDVLHPLDQPGKYKLLRVESNYIRRRIHSLLVIGSAS